MEIAWVLLASAAGICIALQAAANGSLRIHLGDTSYATFFSICGTITTAVVFMLAAHPAPPSWAVLRAAPWWNWIGGPLGALVVLAGAVLTPKIGAAAFVAAFVAGQLACSLLIDHCGAMNVPQQTLTLGRISGAALVFTGVILVRYS